MTSGPFSLLVVTGETSGEGHAAGLIHELQAQNPGWKLDCFGSGGARLRAAGVRLLADVEQLSAIGTWEALAQAGGYWNLYRRIFQEVRRKRPQLAILVDFPDFNLRIAGRLKSLGVPICYFISPQIWAWRASRLKQIRRHVDLMLVILPFEVDFYRRQGVEAHYVGNPLVAAALKAAQGNGAAEPQKPLVALMPGSRAREVRQIFPAQLDAAAYVAERHAARFWVIRAPGISKPQLQEIYGRWRERNAVELDLDIPEGDVYELLPQATCAMVKSGTSTLQASLLQVPFAMVYRISWPSWFLIRPRVSARTFCLANLIAGRRIVPEFIQQRARGNQIGACILELLQSRDRRKQMQADLSLVARRLGGQDAYRQGALQIQDFLTRRGLAQP